jgi:hypothetical protein
VSGRSHGKIAAKLFLPCTPYDQRDYSINEDRFGIQHVIGIEIRIDSSPDEMEHIVGIPVCDRFILPNGSQFRICVIPIGEFTFGEANEQEAQRATS